MRNGTRDCNMHHRGRRHSGFTLVEIMVVVAILGILAALIVPKIIGRSDDARIINLPVTDLVMLFEDSTAGLISFAECRLAERNRPLVATFSQLATPLPTYAVDRPILHTDLLQATLAREFKVTIVAGAGISPEMKLATERLSLRMFQRRAAKSTDEVPAGSVKVIFSNGESRSVATPDALQEAVLPSLKKS